MVEHVWALYSAWFVKNKKNLTLHVLNLLIPIPILHAELVCYLKK